MEYIDDNRLLQKIAAPIQWEKNKPNQNKTVKLFLADVSTHLLKIK